VARLQRRVGDKTRRKHVQCSSIGLGGRGVTAEKRGRHFRRAIRQHWTRTAWLLTAYPGDRAVPAGSRIADPTLKGVSRRVAVRSIDQECRLRRRRGKAARTCRLATTEAAACCTRPVDVRARTLHWQARQVVRWPSAAVPVPRFSVASIRGPPPPRSGPGAMPSKTYVDPSP
jgi:hypothetical protein